MCYTPNPGLERPILLRVHLHTGDPGNAGTANEVDTANWNNYVPAVIYTDGSTTPYMNPATVSGDNRYSDNLQKVTFTNSASMATPSTTVTVTHASVRDHNGNVWVKGPTTSSVLIRDGAPVVISAGALDIAAINL